MKGFTKEVKIALVAIVGVIILFFGMNFLKGLNIFSSTDDYYIEFKDISGLSTSSPIYADGFKVGTVKDVIYDYAGDKPTRVLVGLDKAMRIPAGSTAEIESDFMGNIKVNLLLANNPRERMEAGDTIKGDMSEGLMSRVGAMLPTVEKMLPKLDSILASVNALLADPAIANSLHNVEKITADLTVTTQQLNTMMGGVNKQLPTLMAKANNVMDNTETLTRNLSEIDVQSTMNKVNATLDNVEQMTAKLNSNEGTLGLLMRDPTLYNNLSNTMGSANELLIDLKAHPKRYVHFSLFGRKDK